MKTCQHANVLGDDRYRECRDCGDVVLNIDGLTRERAALKRGARVPVSGVSLDGDTWLRLDRLAKKHQTSIAALVADAAAGLGAIQPELPLRRGYVWVTPEVEARIVELHALGYGPAAIANDVGISRASVYNHLPKESRR